MHPIALALALPLSLLATAAHAACPSDPWQRMELRDSGGGVSVYERLNETTLREMIREKDAETDYVYELRHGIFILTEYELRDGAEVPGTRSQASYDIPEADLPRPVAGLRWSGTAVHVNGADRYEELLSLVVSPGAEVTYGACSYPALALTLTVTYEGGATIQRFDFLPDLEIAVLRQLSEPGEPDLLYDPVAFAVLP